MNGAGNDFVVMDARHQSIDVCKDQLVRLADRNHGVGCDQIVIIHPDADAHCRVVFYNADGSESGACGNATRCVAELMYQETEDKQITIKTNAGLLSCVRQENGLFQVDMGKISMQWQDIPLSDEQDTLHVDLTEGVLRDPVTVNVGNPHVVFFVNDVDAILLEEVGPAIEHHALFPERTNVEVAQVLDNNTISLRVWERGSGETLACGSGACATLVAAFKRGLTGTSATILVKGGELHVTFDPVTNHVFLTGPVEFEFEKKVTL